MACERFSAVGETARDRSRERREQTRDADDRRSGLGIFCEPRNAFEDVRRDQERQRGRAAAVATVADGAICVSVIRYGSDSTGRSLRRPITAWSPARSPVRDLAGRRSAPGFGRGGVRSRNSGRSQHRAAFSTRPKVTAGSRRWRQGPTRNSSKHQATGEATGSRPARMQADSYGTSGSRIWLGTATSSAKA